MTEPGRKPLSEKEKSETFSYKQTPTIEKKFRHVSKLEGYRSKDALLQFLMKKRVNDFEKKHGTIFI